MKYHYEPGAKRWSKHNNQRRSDQDPRSAACREE